MLEQLVAWDEQLFLYLNTVRTDWLDPIMLALTGTVIWIPMYIFIAYFVFREYGKKAFWYMLGIGVAILFADQFTSAFMKPFFERLRPCHDARWQDEINNYGGCGGLYGFASSHASNAFAVASYFTLVFWGRRNAFAWLLLWALIHAYTRIYLGVHYPGDILVGGLVGIIGGIFAWYLATFLINRFPKEP